MISNITNKCSCSNYRAATIKCFTDRVFRSSWLPQAILIFVIMSYVKIKFIIVTRQFGWINNIHHNSSVRTTFGMCCRYGGSRACCIITFSPGSWNLWTDGHYSSGTFQCFWNSIWIVSIRCNSKIICTVCFQRRTCIQGITVNGYQSLNTAIRSKLYSFINSFTQCWIKHIIINLRNSVNNIISSNTFHHPKACGSLYLVHIISLEGKLCIHAVYFINYVFCNITFHRI